MISEAFQHFLKNRGPIQDAQRVEPRYAESYRGRLPTSLIDFWIEYGWGSYADGMLKVCDPAVFAGVLRLILKNDADFRANECYVFAFTAFGQILAWHSQHRVFRVNLLEYWLSAPKFLNEAKKRKEDTEIVSPLLAFEKEQYDPRDNSGRLLYPRAVEKLGRPGLDECFGFFPALPLAGERNLQSLKRVKAPEHFALLAQLETVVLVDLSKLPARAIRDIG